jgi:hypothetical protein
MALTRSNASDEAAKRFEAGIRKLQRLELSRGYIGLLKDAEDLRYGTAQLLSLSLSLRQPTVQMPCRASSLRLD